jgi:O-antigen/teichoic acid export membrane protein
LFLPYLSGVQKTRRQFERRYVALCQIISLVAAMISTPFIVAGGSLVILIYGQKYAAAAGFIGWLGAMWALRLIRVAPTLAAMALGDTRNAMISNAVRTLALPCVLLTAATGGSLARIAICGFVGELMALAVCVGRLQQKHRIPAKPFLKPVAVFTVGMILAGIVAVTTTPHLPWFLSLSAAGGLVLLQFLSMLLAFPELRKELGQMIFKAEVAISAEKVSA